MNLSLSDKRTISRIGPAVFALDRWLRRRQGSYEFCTRALDSSLAELSFYLSRYLGSAAHR